MAVEIADLRTYVGASEGEYDTLLADCLLEAQAMVDHYRTLGVDAVTLLPVMAAVPEPILDRAVKEVAAGLFDRRNAPSGVLPQQFATTDGVGVTQARVPRDPLAPAYGLLRRFVGAW